MGVIPDSRTGWPWLGIIPAATTVSLKSGLFPGGKPVQSVHFVIWLLWPLIKVGRSVYCRIVLCTSLPDGDIFDLGSEARDVEISPGKVILTSCGRPTRERERETTGDTQIAIKAFTYNLPTLPLHLITLQIGGTHQRPISGILRKALATKLL